MTFSSASSTTSKKSSELAGHGQVMQEAEQVDTRLLLTYILFKTIRHVE